MKQEAPDSVRTHRGRDTHKAAGARSPARIRATRTPSAPGAPSALRCRPRRRGIARSSSRSRSRRRSSPPCRPMLRREGTGFREGPFSCRSMWLLHQVGALLELNCPSKRQATQMLGIDSVGLRRRPSHAWRTRVAHAWVRRICTPPRRRHARTTAGPPIRRRQRVRARAHARQALADRVCHTWRTNC